MPPTRSYLEIGKIISLHGLKGELKIKFSANPVAIEQLDFYFIEIQTKKVPFLIENFTWIKENIAILKLEEIDTPEQAQDLKGRNIYAHHHESLFLENDDFSKLIGYEIIDADKNIKGKIVDVYEQKDNPLVEVDIAGKLSLHPFHDDFIVKIIHKSKTVEYSFQQDLLDL